MLNKKIDYIASFISIMIVVIFAILGSANKMINGIPILLIFVIISFIIHWLIFIPSYIFKTEKFYDITGTIAYICIFYVSYLITNKINLENSLYIRSYLTLIMITIWAIRLGGFLFIRVFSVGEDKRFKYVKTSFSKFFLYFTISGVWVFLTTCNALTIIINNSSLSNDIFLKIGFFIWLIGFLIEVISDTQKKYFRKNTKNKNQFINSGLRKISRHPNYFGEILQWFGISIISLPILTGWEFITLISPIFVIILLTKISGINILEKNADEKWGSSKIYNEYKNNTPILVPFITPNKKSNEK